MYIWIRLGSLSLFTVACCSSCLLPVPYRNQYDTAPDTLHIVESGTEHEVPDALVLVDCWRSGRDGRNINQAFVYRAGERFPMYRDFEILLLGPCPQPVSERRVKGFYVVAPGFAPQYFLPEPRRDENARVDWPLHPVSPEKSRESLGQLRTILEQDSVPLSTLKSWAMSSGEGPDDEMPDILLQEIKVKTLLSADDLRAAEEYIVDALKRLQ